MNKPCIFTYRPRIVEAWRYLTKEDADGILEWLNVQHAQLDLPLIKFDKGLIYVPTFFGRRVLGIGDWVVNQGDGNLEIVKPDEFDRTYTNVAWKAGMTPIKPCTKCPENEGV